MKHKNILWGVGGTSLHLSFLKDINFVVDDVWPKLSFFRKCFYEFYWRVMLRKPLQRVCYPSSILKSLATNNTILYLGDIFRREAIIPIASELGFELDKNLFEAFALSPALCSLRRQTVTTEDIKKKDYEDDDIKLAILAKMLPNNIHSICDVGCGQRKLMKIIPSSIKYVGFDYIQKADNIISVDLNKEEMPQINADCYLGCGILEFIDDVDGLLCQITKMRPLYIALSYSPREFSNISTQRSRVYHNCLYSHQITSTICSKGYFLKEFKRYESRQALYLYERC